MGSFSGSRQRAAWPMWAGGGLVAAALLLAGCGGGGGGDAGTAGAQAADIVVTDTAAEAAQHNAAPAVVWSSGTAGTQAAPVGGTPQPDTPRYGIDVCDCSAVSDASAS